MLGHGVSSSAPSMSRSRGEGKTTSGQFLIKHEFIKKDRTPGNDQLLIVASGTAGVDAFSRLANGSSG
jgi:hypothetical protein